MICDIEWNEAIYREKMKIRTREWENNEKKMREIKKEQNGFWTYYITDKH